MSTAWCTTPATVSPRSRCAWAFETAMKGASPQRDQSATSASDGQWWTVWTIGARARRAKARPSGAYSAWAWMTSKSAARSTAAARLNSSHSSHGQSDVSAW